MEPTERKMKILEAVVEAYIKTGDPIGSKAVCEVLDFNVSSATVRNDMAELSNLGLLAQPHTSSGRIPTELGYRIYIDDLMKPVTLNRHEKAAIKDMAEDAVDKVSKDQSTKAAVDKAIGEVEKKVKVDLPDVDSIAKTLGSDKKHS